MYISGDTDRPPVRVGYHSQAYLHAAAEAAAAAMAALYYRQLTGEGQQVDVSVQEGVAQNVAFRLWDLEKYIGHRRGKDAFDFSSPQRGGQTAHVNVTRRWPCKDGYVNWFLWSGAVGIRHNPPFFKWLESEGITDDFIKNFDWGTFDLRTANQETVDRLAEPVGRFFAAHTKAELCEGAARRGIALAAVASSADTMANTQLACRGYWVELQHPELGVSITYPGAFAHISEAPPMILRRAPLIGEHNREIYQGELGLSDEQLVALKEASVI